MISHECFKVLSLQLFEKAVFRTLWTTKWISEKRLLPAFPKMCFLVQNVSSCFFLYGKQPLTPFWRSKNLFLTPPTPLPPPHHDQYQMHTYYCLSWLSYRFLEVCNCQVTYCCCFPLLIAQEDSRFLPSG